MPYGILKVDTVTFTSNGVDKSVSISGLVQNPTFSGNITSTGTISGVTIQGGTLVSGATVTGSAGQFSTLTAISGIFTSQISGAVHVAPVGSATAPSVSVGAGTTYAPGIYSPGADQLALATAGTGRLFVDASGNVGLSVNPPTNYANYATLSINGTSGGAISLRSNGTMIGEIFSTSSALKLGSNTGQPLVFETNGGIERLRITSDGKVGIGTSSPSERLDLGGGVSDTVKIRFSMGGNVGSIGSVGSGVANGLGNLAFFTRDGSVEQERMRITGDGKVGIGTSSPGSALEVNGESRFTRSGVSSQYLSVAADSADTRIVAEGSSKNLTIKNNSTTSSAILFDQAVASSYIFSQAGTEHLRLTSDGKLGLGVSAPSELLHIKQNTANTYAIARLEGNNRGGEIDFYNGATALAAVYADSNKGLNFTTNGTSSLAATIDSSGRLLVGTSSNRTGAAFQIEGTTFGTSLGTITNNSNNTAPAYFQLIKSRGTVVGSQALVSNGDGLGNVQFVGTDGTQQIVAASVEGIIDGTPGANDMPGRLVFSTTADGASSPTERFRIDSSGTSTFTSAASTAPFIAKISTSEVARIDGSGRLLVGTSSATNVGGAARLLQLEATSAGTQGQSILVNGGTSAGNAPVFILGRSRGTTLSSTTAVAQDDTLGYLQFVGANGSDLSNIAAQITAVVDGAVSGGGVGSMPGRLVFSTTPSGSSSPVERMRVSSTGQAYVVSTWYAITAISTQSAGTSVGLFEGKHSGTAGALTGTLSYVVYTNGNVQNTNNSYSGISDIKLKENIADAASQWDDIKALQVRKYNFKKETGQQTHTQIGLVAQEVELVSPGLVAESPDRDADGNDLGTVTKSVNYSVLYMKAVKALQEAMERIEQLETKVAALEGA